MAAPMILSKAYSTVTSQADVVSLNTCTTSVSTRKTRLHSKDNTMVKNYTMNDVKCLQKKKNYCDRPFINIIPKDSGRQLKIECSTGCYELLKVELTEMTVSNDVSDKFNIVFTTENVSDLKGNSPEFIIRANNKLNSGAPGKRSKFTINLYHTQCSLLINGNNVSTFQDEILPHIMENLEKNPKLNSLDRMYANIIDRCLSQSIQTPDQHVSLIADPCAILPQGVTAADDSQHLGSEQEEKRSPDICIHCDMRVIKGIACDNCEQWNHFDCEQLDKNLENFYQDGNSPYSCLSCRQLSLRPDHSLCTENCADENNNFDIIDNEPIPIPNVNTLENENNMMKNDNHMNVSVPETKNRMKNDNHTNVSVPETKNSSGTTNNEFCVFVSDSGGEEQITTRKSMPENNINKTKMNPEGTETNEVPVLTQKKQTRRKKNETAADNDLAQQVDHSASMIQRLERKIEDLERANKLSYLQNQAVAPNSRLQEPSQDSYPSLEHNLSHRISNLEKDLLHSRLSSLESMQQLSLQINTLTLQTSLTTQNFRSSPTYHMTHPPPLLTPWRYPPPFTAGFPPPGPYPVPQHLPVLNNYPTAHAMPPWYPQGMMPAPKHVQTTTAGMNQTSAPMHQECLKTTQGPHVDKHDKQDGPMRSSENLGQEIPRKKRLSNDWGRKYKQPPRFDKKLRPSGLQQINSPIYELKSPDIHSTPKNVRFDGVEIINVSNITMQTTTPDTSYSDETIQVITAETEKKTLPVQEIVIDEDVSPSMTQSKNHEDIPTVTPLLPDERTEQMPPEVNRSDQSSFLWKSRASKRKDLQRQKAQRQPSA